MVLAGGEMRAPAFIAAWPGGGGTAGPIGAGKTGAAAGAGVAAVAARWAVRRGADRTGGGSLSNSGAFIGKIGAPGLPSEGSGAMASP